MFSKAAGSQLPDRFWICMLNKPAEPQEENLFLLLILFYVRPALQGGYGRVFCANRSGAGVGVEKDGSPLPEYHYSFVACATRWLGNNSLVCVSVEAEQRCVSRRRRKLQVEKWREKSWKLVVKTVFFLLLFFSFVHFFFFAQKGLNDKRNISIVFVTGLGLNLSVVAVKQETPQYLSVCVCVCVALPLGTILRKRP